jgi:DNA-binding NarL/FixJ family response regulator
VKPVIMLVDDDPGILSALKRMLRRDGYELVTHSNARAALDELETRQVDVIVSDYKMPGKNGIDLLEEVARSWPRTARILLSGWSNEIPTEKLVAARLHAQLAKPWDEDELKSAIRKGVGSGG